jgi:hypothetical protein
MNDNVRFSRENARAWQRHHKHSWALSDLNCSLWLHRGLQERQARKEALLVCLEALRLRGVGRPRRNGWLYSLPFDGCLEWTGWWGRLRSGRALARLRTCSWHATCPSNLKNTWHIVPRLFSDKWYRTSYRTWCNYDDLKLRNNTYMQYKWKPSNSDETQQTIAPGWHLRPFCLLMTLKGEVPISKHVRVIELTRERRDIQEQCEEQHHPVKSQHFQEAYAI